MRLLFLVTQNYSFRILAPMQEVALEREHEVRWFVGNRASLEAAPGELVSSTSDVLEYSPDAVFAPGNVMPNYWPGLKVQLFHGLCEEKRGHYRITEFFDLYCTPGPMMTERFESLAKKHGSFLVRETGWPKLDGLRADRRESRKKELGISQDTPLVLFAPTFSPRLTSAPRLLAAIQDLLSGGWSWIVKFHPLMDPEWVARYRALECETLKVSDSDDILPLMEAADVMLTDTSSVAYEFLSLERPLITFRAQTRPEKGLDIQEPDELGRALRSCLDQPEQTIESGRRCMKMMHPYTDSRSAERVISAAEEVLRDKLCESLREKRPSWLRRRRIRKMIP